MSKSAKSRARALSQSLTAEDEENGGTEEPCSDLIADSTLYQDETDSISNGTTRKLKAEYNRKMISSASFSAAAGGFAMGYMQERGGPSARDVLLLKCRDAIETLHIELEDERSEKQRLVEESSEMQTMIQDF